jgi:hypothetical protein
MNDKYLPLLSDTCMYSLLSTFLFDSGAATSEAYDVATIRYPQIALVVHRSLRQLLGDTTHAEAARCHAQAVVAPPAESIHDSIAITEYCGTS